MRASENTYHGHSLTISLGVLECSLIIRASRYGDLHRYNDRSVKKRENGEASYHEGTVQQRIRAESTPTTRTWVDDPATVRAIRREDSQACDYTGSHRSAHKHHACMRGITPGPGLYLCSGVTPYRLPLQR